MIPFLRDLIPGLTFTTIIAIAIGLIRYRNLNLTNRIILYYLIYSLVNGVVMFILSINNHNNLFFYNSYMVIEFAILAVFFWFSTQLRWLKGGIIVFAIIFFGTLLISLNAKQGYLNLLKMVETISIFSWGLVLAIQENSRNDKLTHSPRFWISAGLMLYSSPAFLIAAASNQIVLLPIEQAYIIWSLNSIFYGIMVVFISIAFLRCSRT